MRTPIRKLRIPSAFKKIGAVSPKEAAPFLEDKKFPNSVYSVCFQPGAFDAVRDGQYYMEPDKESINAAKAALGGWDPTYGALYYWNPDTATSKWIWSRKVITQIGKHVFGI